MKTVNQTLQSTVDIIDRYQNEFLSPQLADTYVSISGLDTSCDFLTEAYNLKETNNFSGNKKDLHLRLEEFTEGDTEFIGEFANYILFNMNYIESNLSDYFVSKEINELCKLIHRVKPTIEMLGDTDLMRKLSTIKDEWENGNFDERIVGEVVLKVNFYKNQLAEIVESEQSR